MKRLIKNYTTDIPVERTVAEIQKILSDPTSTVWLGKHSWISALGFLGTTPCGAGRGRLNRSLRENRGKTLIFGVQGSEMPSSAPNANTVWPTRSRQKTLPEGQRFLAPQFDRY